MVTTTKRSVQILVEIARQRGLEHIVFSPGSRNAPLVIGFNAYPEFDCLNIPDERVAAFFAVGMMQHLEKPVAICCTSGSAAANYYPAVTEAFYQKVPLIILTEDRPQAWIDQGDGQTIRQQNLFANHIKYSANLLEDDDAEALWYNKRVINEAFDAAMHPEPGPVHINLPFREPLYQTTSENLEIPAPVHTLFAKADLNQSGLESLASQWNNSTKKMILLGQMLPNHRLDTLVEKLANDPSVMVFTESTSNVTAEGMFPCIDRMLATFSEQDIEMLRPEILLTLGGAVISKKIKAFLRKGTQTHHWHVQRNLPHPDTYKILTHQILASPIDFLEQFAALVTPKASDYKKELIALDAIRDKRHLEIAPKLPWSDWKAYHMLLPFFSSDIALQSANSSVIRYIQLFKEGRAADHFCNRGTSGIDGSTSTAAGYCYASGRKTVLITGDISFLYDSNGLYHNYKKNNFKIILINNGGGGIFRIIDGPKDSQYLESFFEARQEMSGEHFARAYGLNYQLATSETELAAQLGDFFAKDEAPTILEIRTPGRENAQVLKTYFGYLRHGNESSGVV